MIKTEIETYYAIVFFVLTGIIGLCVGSFLNVVIYRVPLGLSVAKPASHCPECKNPIKWYDNIPVVSYTLLRGKCRNCGVHIPFRYTAVEISNTVAWLLCAWRFYDGDIKSAIFSVIAMATASSLICVFFIDLENSIIPDRFHLIIGTLGIAGIFFSNGTYSGGKAWLSNVIGALVGFSVFFIVGYVMSKILKREALGGGDIKFSLVMGLFLGWQRWLLALLLSSLVASFVLTVVKRRSSDGEEDGKEYPFGPFLSAAFFIALLFGDAVISWYIGMLI